MFTAVDSHSKVASMAVKFVEQKEVAVADLHAHPDNPNRGSVDDLAVSLEEFGQFRSIVGLPDGTILAGHHLVEAAKRIGLKTVRVDIIDTDDKTARKIMLADNRLADLGLGPNLDLLLKNLEQLGEDISGTGFDEDYVRMLEEAVSGPPNLDDLADEADETPSKPEDFYRRLTILIDPRFATKWEAIRKLYQDDNTAFAALLGEETPEG
jgi:site-specific DNA-methyltransferase (adenine-specific)